MNDENINLPTTIDSGIDTSIVDDQINSIAQQILNEQDIKAVKDLTHLFNLNQSKKNVLRIMKLNGLLDKVSDEMIKRFELVSDLFSNTELINYLQIIQNSIDKASKTLNLVNETPTIQLNQNNININVEDDRFNRDSKINILEVIDSIIDQINKQADEEPDYIEIIEDEKGENNNDETQ